MVVRTAASTISPVILRIRKHIDEDADDQAEHDRGGNGDRPDGRRTVDAVASSR